MATLAHELRNLLSPLTYSLTVLEHGREDARIVKRTLTVAQRQVAHMRYLVDELMDLGRVVNDHMVLGCERIDLRVPVADVMQTFGPSNTGLSVSTRLSSEPLWVDGDTVRITQVLSNLLGNAAKFTPSGGAVAVEARSDADWAIVTVRDSGAGIDVSDLESIFTMFKQVKNPASPSKAGLGIGLALVRRIVHLHGGDVQASSPGKGQGSTFTVRLPLASSGARAHGGKA